MLGGRGEIGDLRQVGTRVSKSWRTPEMPGIAGDRAVKAGWRLEAMGVGSATWGREWPHNEQAARERTA